MDDNQTTPSAFKRFLSSAAHAPMWLIAAAILLPFGLLLLIFMRNKPAPEEAGTDPIPGAPPEPGEAPTVIVPRRTRKAAPPKATDPVAVVTP